MGDILNFNPDRKLAFDPSRSLIFEPGRALQFDPNRPLIFEPNRDLGFGRRGVVFRGYVCPICGSLATEDAPKCTECGAVFEQAPRADRPPRPIVERLRAPKEPTRDKPGPALEPAAAPAKKGKFCAFCGAKLKAADSFCWNCGARFEVGRETVTLPPQRSEPVTREWRGPKEP